VTRSTTATLTALALFVAACGGAGEVTGANPDEPVQDPATAICAEGEPDCVDTVVEDPDLDAIDEGALLRDAGSLLGMTEQEALDAFSDVRVGRHGDESMMLTEDYVIGRKTIATEDDGTGAFRVVEVTIELTDGPNTVTDAS
jgi:hypothetical protein